MKIKKHAVFFLIVFTLFLAVPSIMSVVKKAAAISYFFDGAEEEKKGETETKENSIVFTCVNIHNALHGVSCNLDNHCHTFKAYTDIILDKPLPPPEA